MTRTPLATKDFVDDDGEPVAVHPASAMITLLSRLQRDHQQLQDLATDIDALKPDKHADAQEALEVAQSHFDTADSSEKTDELENALGEVERRVAAARRRPIRTLVSVDRVVVDQAEHAAIRRQVLSSSTTFRSLASTANRLLTHFKGAFKVPILWVVTAFVIAVVIAWAILTLALTVYDPKPAFGKATDYWTLLAAATGSGAAGAALALLAAWDPSAPAEDA